MAFTHGVYKSERATSIIAPTENLSGLPVIVGTAPVFLGDEKNVNRPVLCYSYSEAVKNFGYSDDWENYTLCEFIYSQFALYGQSPAVLINVFDPGKHKEEITEKEFIAIDGVVNLGPNVIKSAGIITDVNSPFVSSYDDEGNCILTFSGHNGKVKVEYTKAKPELVTESEIIGGVSVQTGKATGLELISQVYPRLRMIPGIIGCPKWSEKSSVAAVMRAKSENINGIFSCVCVVDIPSDLASGAPVYSAVPSWKNANNYTHERMIACWPLVELGDKKFHLSTQIIGLMNRTDNQNENVPYKSPSNELLQIDGVINAAGEEINLGLEEANYLNSQGITTALNFSSGWVAWGNRTAAYPANTDPKDNFIPVRRMFDFVGNTFITTFWQRVDAPITLRLIQTVINTFNLYLNGLTARGMLLGGRIEFHEDENAITDLMNGILRFHVFLTPPVPAETIEAIFEYDPEYLNELFAN